MSATATVPGLSLRSATAADVALLRKLGSPLHKQFEDGVAHLQKAARGKRAVLPPAPAMSNTEACEALYVLTVPTVQVAAELTSGRDHFRERALAATLDTFSPNEIAAVLAPAVASYLAAFVKGAMRS